MDKIIAFGFNTTNGTTISLSNVTIEEIVEHLHSKFPKWSNEVCVKIATNPTYHKAVIPCGEKVTKRSGRFSFSKPIYINGVEINDILKVARTLNAYHKNAYKQWGVNMGDVFSAWNILPYYNDFERSYDKVMTNLPNGSDVQNKVYFLDMCNKLVAFQNIVNGRGIIKNESEKGYVSGLGRRIGLITIISEIGDNVPKMIERIH